MVKTENELGTHKGKTEEVCYELDGCKVLVHRQFCAEGTTVLRQLIGMLLDMMETEKLVLATADCDEPIGE